MLASVLGVCQKNYLGANVLGDPNEGAHEKNYMSAATLACVILAHVLSALPPVLL